MDGVVANFESRFAPLLTEVTGITFPVADANFPPVWNWPEHYGVSMTDLNIAWSQVKGDRTFWGSLEEEDDAREALAILNGLEENGLADVYFITHRMGKKAKYATENWLIDRGMDNPTVMLVRDKHLAAVALQLDVYVDDRIENVNEVKRFTEECGIPTRVYLISKPYNQGLVTFPGVAPMESLRAVLEVEYGVS
jgi:hypothetical protein